MEVSTILALIGLVLCILCLIIINYDIRYKGECILHDWKYRYVRGDFWKYTGTFLRKNEHYECRKCWREKRYK